MNTKSTIRFPMRGYKKLGEAAQFNPPTPAQKERMAVIQYLQRVEVEGMRKLLCFSCAFVTLYDKNNKQYRVSRITTLQEVKDIVEEIKKVNESE